MWPFCQDVNLRFRLTPNASRPLCNYFTSSPSSRFMNPGLQPSGSMDSPSPGKRRTVRTEFGLKELAPGIKPDLDIVAIHGIDGDREDSWTAGNGTLWLRDLLPTKIPNARILTYGYDANTHGQEQLTKTFMHDHAETFISKLVLFRGETATAERPIIFVAYSFGGLLLKSALIHSHSCNDNHLKSHHQISQSTHGVAFFGTPHQGSGLARSTNSLEINSVLLRHLETDSEGIQSQLRQYLSISGQFETKFFYEMYEMGTGILKEEGVTRASAVVPGAVNAEAMGIYKDHVHLVKFPSADDEDFRTVSTALFLMSRAAQQKRVEKGDDTITEFTLTPSTLTPSQERALSNLRPVRAARFGVDRRPSCLKGTRVGLLETISEWSEQDISRQIFWLCGQAGMGKTTVSLTVAGDCKRRGRLGASFFFSRDSAERSDIQLVFPTLAQHLGKFHLPFRKSLAKVLERDPEIVYLEPMHQIRELIVEPLKSCGSFPTSTIIVIDALDECKDDEPISTMISTLSAHIHELPCLKFFITSRPESHIVAAFRLSKTFSQSVILQDIEGSVVDADIELYLRNRFATTLAQFSGEVTPGWPSDESIKSLVRMSGRLFIFAATAMTFIQDETDCDPPNQLSILLGESPATYSHTPSPFASINRLYLQVLRHAFPEQTTPPSRFSLLRMVLGAIVLSREPLSAASLAMLLRQECRVVRAFLRKLHSVMVIPVKDELPIRLIHPSFFEFVTCHCSDPNFQIVPSVYHEMLGIKCFEQMKGLKRNICSIQDASKLNSEIEDLAERVERCIPPAMQYACRHWLFHLRLAPGSTLRGMLGEFFCRRILYWIEVLSLLDRLQEGIRHLRDFLDFLNTFLPPSHGFLVAFSDTVRFMADLFEPISCASLQLYRSALPLLPRSSFLRRTFHRELDGGMQVLQGNWLEENVSGVIVLRVPTFYITSVEFSPDGKMLASTSETRELCLWDCRTGTLRWKLTAPHRAKLIWARFFPDGGRVIAATNATNASNTAYIYIWNVVSGTRIHAIRLRGVPQQAMRCYTISPGLQRIVGAAYHEIYVWHTSTGRRLAVLKSHFHEIQSLAFSSDGKLASTSFAHQSICIWNITDGTILQTLDSAGRVTSVSFSPDSKYIVFGSHDEGAVIWDLSNHFPLNILDGDSFRTNSVAFSPDGARVISGSVDRNLRVWDAISGELLKTVTTPGQVEKVGISPDGARYVSTREGSIYVWHVDPASNLPVDGFNQRGFDGHGTSITDPADSEENRQFVDGITGRFMSFRSKTPIMLSPNQKYIAFCPYGTDLCLWDIASRTVLWESKIDPIPSNSSSSDTASFSSDSTRIVSPSVNALHIRDVADGKILFTIDLDYKAESASFSQDGSQIITEVGRYNIPPHVRQHSIPLMDEHSERLRYSIDGEWIFASNGTKKERCVWLPPDWRRKDSFIPELVLSCSSSRGQVAIATPGQLIILDLSGIQLSI